MDVLQLKQLFPGLEAGLYQEMTDHASVKTVKAGDTLLRVGQTIRSTMLIAEGIIKMYREDDEGNEFFIYHLTPGDACSLSFICSAKPEKSEVLAKALTDATVISIPPELMEAWMMRYKSWYQFVLNAYRTRFESLLQTIDAIAFSTMDERLEFYLKRQVAQFGKVLTVTHQEIAHDLNSSREVISRLLKKMESKGLLALNRNSIEWLV